MALAHAVLTSAPCQSHNYESIYLNFGVDDNVPVYTNPARLGLGGGSSWGPRWWWHMHVVWLFLFLFLNSSSRVQTIPVNWFSCTVAWKTRSDIRKCLSGVKITNSKILGKFNPQNTPKMARNRLFPAKMKSRITSKRLKIGEICQWSMNIKLGSPFQNPSLETIYGSP